MDLQNAINYKTKIDIKKVKVDKTPDWKYGDILYCTKDGWGYAIYQIRPGKSTFKEELDFAGSQVASAGYVSEKFQLHPIGKLDMAIKEHIKYESLIITSDSHIYDSMKELYEDLARMYTKVQRVKKLEVYVEE